MQKMIEQLKNIFEKNPIGQKVLIAPSYSAGRQLVQSCVKQGLYPLNLSVETLSGLAEQVCKQILFKAELALIPVGLANELFIGIFKGLLVSGQLAYFNTLEATSGVSRALYMAILDLKMAGLKVNQVSSDKFVNPLKAEDIRLMWTEYEKELKARKYLDLADLFQLALDQSLFNPKCMFIVPTNIKLSTLERNFLRALTNENYEVIQFGRPKAIDAPQSSLEREFKSTEKDEEPFSSLLWLLDLANLPTPTEMPLEIFRSYGESNEVREVLRRIKKRNIPFDQVMIYYTAREPYSYLFYTIAQQLDIPMTFGQGIDICCTKPGRLYFGLLSWVQGGFKVSDLVPLITNGEFGLEDKDAPSKSFITHFLRTSGIGWGRDRYLSIIESKLTQLNSDIKSEDELNDHKLSQLTKLKWLNEFIEQVFHSAPELNSEHGLIYGELADWLLKLVKQYGAVFGKADGEAKKIICEELEQIRDNLKDRLQPEEAFTRLTSMIEGKRVSVSTPEPGSLHIDDYRNGLWISRPNVYVVGLDANRFPGSFSEDPILLDLERKNLANGLFLYGSKPKENLYELIQLLGSVPKTLNVSFSAFDTVESRLVFPSSVLLQIFRLISHDETLNYSDLLNTLGERRGFTPIEQDEALEEIGWWLNSLSSGNRTFDESLVKKLYSSLSNGLSAEARRNELGLTPYDGKVDVESVLVDPTENQELVMSSSQLETLAKCPFSYFLRYILKIQPLQEITFDPSVWLDPKEKGDLYHLIFERFYKGLAEKDETPKLTQHENYLYEIADEIITQKRVTTPPPSELVFEYERQSILDSCHIFLKAEEIEAVNDKPKYFELTFGMPGDDSSTKFNAVPIILPNGKQFHLRGRIDRVDECEQGLKVFDYKTGSTYGYTDLGYFKGGRQLQHALYPVALEWLFRENGIYSNPIVTEAGYIFPTVRGEGKRVLRNQSCRDSLYEVLDHLFDLLSEGNFVMTDDKGDCNICDFKEACNRHYRGDESLQKMMIDAFRRLRSHA